MFWYIGVHPGMLLSTWGLTRLRWWSWRRLSNLILVLLEWPTYILAPHLGFILVSEDGSSKTHFEALYTVDMIFCTLRYNRTQFFS